MISAKSMNLWVRNRIIAAKSLELPVQNRMISPKSNKFVALNSIHWVSNETDCLPSSIAAPQTLN
jgi:hypothetical protein